MSSSFKSHRSYSVFSKTVKNNSRYIFDDETNAFLEAVKNTCSSRSISFVKGESFWRAQVGCDYNPYDQDDECVDDIPVSFSPKRMKPLPDRASEGRLNPKGIPCLYVALDKETAMSEVRPGLDSLISVGRFEATKDLNVIDLTKGCEKIKLYFKEPDEPERTEVVWAKMNASFSLPISNSDSVSDYAPTQIIAEVFKSLGYDGVAYGSSLRKEGVNIALFDLDSASIVERSLYRVAGVDFRFNIELNRFS